MGSARSPVRGKRAVMITAGIVAGLSRRFAGYPPARRMVALSEATIFAYAFAGGCVMLSRNMRGSDLINQMIPNGWAPFYDSGL